jgi:hypothetical protein
MFGSPIPVPAAAMGVQPPAQPRRRGLFGAPLAADAAASSIVQTPNADQPPPYATPGILDRIAAPTMAPASDNFDFNQGMANATEKKPGFFAEGGIGRIMAGSLGDALSQMNGGQPTFALEMAARRRAAREQQAQAAEWAHQGQVKADDRQYEANKPQYFMAGNDRVMFDPGTQTAQTIYDAPEPFQTYAHSMGYEPDTPEYRQAQQDYVLRGNGPTAYGYDVGLENTRQQNRVGLEGIRYNNRAALRSAPTYSDLHPKPRASGGGGRSGGSYTPRTMAGVVAPIVAKVARGESLTPGEQQALNTYRPERRGGANSGASLPTISSPAEAAKLPSGTRFRTPDGTVRTKP